MKTDSLEPKAAPLPKLLVYLLYYLIDKREPSHIRYVGITTNPTQRFKAHKRYDNPQKHFWMRTTGRYVEMVIVGVYFSKEEVLKAEAAEITRLLNGGHELFNLSYNLDDAPRKPISKKRAKACVRKSYFVNKVKEKESNTTIIARRNRTVEMLREGFNTPKR